MYGEFGFDLWKFWLLSQSLKCKKRSTLLQHVLAATQLHLLCQCFADLVAYSYLMGPVAGDLRSLLSFSKTIPSYSLLLIYRIIENDMQEATATIQQTAIFNILAC